MIAPLEQVPPVDPGAVDQWPLDDPELVLSRLSALPELDRRRAVHTVIRRLATAASTTEVRMAIRDGLAGRKLFGKRDFVEVFREAARIVGADGVQQTASVPYTVGGDGYLYLRRDGDEPRRIASFAPEVVADVERDDGAERVRTLRVRVTLPSGRCGEVDVPPAKLADPVDWAVRAAGVRAVVLAVPGAREHVRAAAQLLAAEHLPTQTIYVHTGWRQIAGRWRYLSAAGALGADGLTDSVLVDLPGKLAGYHLPDPCESSAADLREAVQASLAVLDVAPDAATVPVLAAAFRAPLPLPSDGSVYLVGRTGAGKSQLVALAQQHFGPSLDGQHLPGSWSSTGNALAEQAFLLADALFTVDDYVPAGSTSDLARLRRTAEQLLRGAANGAGRDRLDATATLRTARPPRAQILATGEDLPPGQSLRGRMFITELAPDALEWDRLGGHQQRAAAGTFAVAMAGYVRWLAGRLDDGDLSAATLTETRATLRAQAAGSGQHRRTPDMIASLVLGWQCWLDYAAAVSAVDAAGRDAYARRVWAALVAGADEQADAQGQMDPVAIYLEVLSSAISSGAAHLSALSGGVPLQAAAWGWEQVMVGADLSDRPRGARIGWLDGEHVFLDPGAAYTVAVRQAALASLPSLPGEPTLRKRLDEARLLASTEERGGKRRLTVRRTVDGARRVAVLHLHTSVWGVGAE
ncbi:hypothetical protein [Frankia tisae]|uniref:hypothetical protein n=1 Tax=Frankia tisae TaxID=2950104 RepID=UPI0021C202D1|nr:hypothetical protein [Frankia tisae]